MREGGRDKLLKRLSDPALRERAKADMAKETTEWENQYLGSGGAESVMVAEVLDPKLKPYEGRTIAAIAADEKKDPRDVVIDIVLADRANAACIIAIMDEADVRAALASPLVSFGRRRTRAAGARRRGSWATTSASRKCCASRKRSAR